jgi:predicted permease
MPKVGSASLLFSIFVTDLLPVFAIAAVGFVLARYWRSTHARSRG